MKSERIFRLWILIKFVFRRSRWPFLIYITHCLHKWKKYFFLVLNFFRFKFFSIFKICKKSIPGKSNFQKYIFFTTSHKRLQTYLSICIIPTFAIILKSQKQHKRLKRAILDVFQRPTKSQKYRKVKCLPFFLTRYVHHFRKLISKNTSYVVVERPPRWSSGRASTTVE